MALSAFTSADCFRDRDAYGINHHKQKKRADEYTSSEKVPHKPCWREAEGESDKSGLARSP
jgi:hypothetical protein